MERSGSAFLERVRRGYRELVASNAAGRLVDASGTPDEVHGRVRAVLTDAWPETFSGSGVST